MQNLLKEAYLYALLLFITSLDHVWIKKYYNYAKLFVSLKKWTSINLPVSPRNDLVKPLICFLTLSTFESGNFTHSMRNNQRFWIFEAEFRLKTRVRRFHFQRQSGEAGIIRKHAWKCVTYIFSKQVHITTMKA